MDVCTGSGNLALGIACAVPGARLLACDLSEEAVALDDDEPPEVIAKRLRELVTVNHRRRGLVVGISGGIDSALCTALAVRAFGPCFKKR